ncbi:MAG TPA: hypothetical protein VK213_12005 [Bacteroidales bacterium]|nr:hypothetical protein [Bacteroidales bacterium]
MKKLFKLLFAVTAFGFLNPCVFGQENSVELLKSSINVFLDCRCDINYIREEIPYINYVRDVKEAQVYVRVTSQNTASGGEQYTVAFQGLQEFTGMNDTLNYVSYPDETVSITRATQARILKAGLMRFVAHTPIVREIQITHTGTIKSEEVIDKWNNWVFQLQTSPSFNAEESYKTLNLRNSVSISKVTPDIKLEIDFYNNYNRQKYITGSVENIYVRKSESASMLFVKSIGEHWSAGFRAGLGANSQSNQNLYGSFMPAIEYDLFPYSEATHRQMRILYSAGYQYNDYIDTTIYNLMNEQRLRQELSLGYMIQEKWGSINVSLSGNTYLHDLSKNSVDAYVYVRLRLLKGLSLSLSANGAYINDRLNQRKGTLTEAERLLRLKQQATSFEIGGSVGLNYTFGSIYNNVVNPRFDRL